MNLEGNNRLSRLRSDANSIARRTSSNSNFAANEQVNSARAAVNNLRSSLSRTSFSVSSYLDSQGIGRNSFANRSQLSFSDRLAEAGSRGFSTDTAQAETYIRVGELNALKADLDEEIDSLIDKKDNTTDTNKKREYSEQILSKEREIDSINRQIQNLLLGVEDSDKDPQQKRKEDLEDKARDLQRQIDELTETEVRSDGSQQVNISDRNQHNTLTQELAFVKSQLALM